MILVGSLVSSQLQNHSLVFESFESKSISGGPVFNQITLSSTASKDVWRMRQSHQGLSVHAEDWDELVLEVDKSVRPYQAHYAQLKNGIEVEYRVSCFLCHANGPRLIRPNYQSPSVKLGVKDYLAIGLWNFKIKIYGEIQTAQNNQLAGKMRKVPLKYESNMDTELLKLKTCTHCHNPDTLSGRSFLQRQHAMTIEHLVDNGIMPPFPFKLSEKERKQIKQFTNAL